MAATMRTKPAAAKTEKMPIMMPLTVGLRSGYPDIRKGSSDGLWAFGVVSRTMLGGAEVAWWSCAR